MRKKALFLILIVVPVSVGLFYFWARQQVVHDTQYNSFVHEAALRYHMNESLIRAVIWRESDFDPDATGLAGERGLMQVTPVAGREWAASENIQTFRDTDLLDPRTNIMAGSWYLGRAIRRWQQTDRPEIFGLAEYNAGRTHARRWARDLPTPTSAVFIENIDYPTTKSYVLDILERSHYYETHPRPNVWEKGWNKLLGHWWRWLESRKVQRLREQHTTGP